MPWSGVALPAPSLALGTAMQRVHGASLARIACANVGAAPSLEMPMTNGKRNSQLRPGALIAWRS